MIGINKKIINNFDPNYQRVIVTNDMIIPHNNKYASRMYFTLEYQRPSYELHNFRQIIGFLKCVINVAMKPEMQQL